MSSQTQTDPTTTASTSSSTAESSSSVKSSSIARKQSTKANKQTVDKANRTKRFLWITIVLLLFAVGLSAALIYLFTRTSSSASKTNSTDHDGQQGQPSCVSCCQTESCQRYSRTLMDVMDFSVDPCDNFHKYACGNWHKHEPSYDGEHHGSTNYWSVQKKFIYETFRLSLEDGHKSPSKSKAIQYLSDLYHECLDVQRREQLGIEPLQQLLKQMFGRELWPLLGTSTYSHINNVNQELEHSIFTEFSEFWKSDNSSNLRKTNDSSEFNSIWSFWKSWKLWQSNKDMIKPDYDQANVHLWMDCYVEASLLGVPLFTSHILHFFKSEINAYMKPDEYAIIIFLASHEDINEEIADLFQNFNKYKEAIFPFSNSHDHWNTSMDYAIFEVMQLKIKFSRLLKSKKASYDAQTNATTDPMITLGELKRNYNSLDWTLLLNKYASRTRADFRFTDHDTVYVPLDQLELFKPFSELIANTPIRVLKNAMALQVIFQHDSELLSFLDIKNRIKVYTKFPFSKKCLLQLFPLFSPIYTRLFVDSVGRVKMQAARDQVIEMVHHIKETIGESMKADHSWLDDQTRREALDKLEAIKYYIGFPDWILQDDILDEVVGFDISKTEDSLLVAKGHYATSYYNLVRIVNSGQFRRAKVTKSNPSERYFLFSSGNYAALYSDVINALAITFAYLSNGPWFDVDYPAAINYGNIGMAIGHEIFHAFDNNGRLYDKHGHKTNWWTDSTSEHFHNLSQCFLHQYDGIVNPVTGIKVNATSSLGEIIADNSGLKQAYRAFEKHLEHSRKCCTSETLPKFMGHFSNEQLFFLSYSQYFCTAQKNSTVMYEIALEDVHPPDDIRVRMTLSNIAPMAQAFNCPVGSPMNPKHKCSIW